MKTTTKLITLSAIVGLMLSLSVSSVAQDIYVCGTGVATLKYNGGYVLKPGDKVFWQEFEDATLDNPTGGAIERTFTSDNDDVNYKLNGGAELTSAGSHYYRAHVVTADIASCESDVSEPVHVFMLPEFEVTLNATSDAYCETDSATGSVVSATVVSISGSPALPLGVDYTYTWTGDGVVDASDSKKYTLTTATTGTHTITLAVSYDVSTTTKMLKGTGGACEESATKDIEVTAQPTKPTISVD